MSSSSLYVYVQFILRRLGVRGWRGWGEEGRVCLSRAFPKIKLRRNILEYFFVSFLLVVGIANTPSTMCCSLVVRKLRWVLRRVLLLFIY